MSVFINGTGCISPQRSFDESFFEGHSENYTSDYLPCVLPVYKDYINPVMLRRMSKIMKMGVTSALIALKDAAVEVPDAIISGTAYGCIEDTEIFLNAILEYNETLLTPTAFIQSTHNTINSMIAIIKKCTGYNFTYVHRSFSFENAILDGMIQLENNEARNVLVGGYDELTTNQFNIYKRMHLWKYEIINSLDLLASTSPGTITGQGSSFFIASNEKSETTYCELKGLKTIFEPKEPDAMKSSLNEFLMKFNLTGADIDLCILGLNGDKESNRWYNYVTENYVPEQSLAAFKHLCGDYQTSSAFAFWLGANIIKRQIIPDVSCLKNKNIEGINNVLIYNHYNGTHHSFFLLSKC